MPIYYLKINYYLRVYYGLRRPRVAFEHQEDVPSQKQGGKAWHSQLPRTSHH
jgi:hypothetical protein